MVWFVIWAILKATPSVDGLRNYFPRPGFVIYVGFIAVNDSMTIFWRVYDVYSFCE